MKLELKHLAPYLPYGLKAEMLDYKIDYVGRQYDEIIGIHEWSKNKDWCLLTDGGSKPSIERIKPILRPLSSMTASEKILFHNENMNTSTNNILPEINASRLLNWFLSDRSIQSTIWLLSHHFDIFGLIKAGLAINKNDIQQ